MSMPVVLRSTFNAALAKAAEIEAELRRETEALREALAQLHDDRDAMETDRDRVAAALARATADRDRFAAALATKQQELGEALSAFEAYREATAREAEAASAAAADALGAANAATADAEARLAAEASMREQAQSALADAQGQLAQTARRLDDFRAETERLGAQVIQMQAMHRADIEAIARGSAERERISKRLEAFEAEVERLGNQVLGVIAENRELSKSVDTSVAEKTLVEQRLKALATQLRAPEPIQAASKSYFIVSSLGRTATQWQVSGLNRHPLVLATHALDLSPERREPASRGDEFLQSLERQADVRRQNLDLDAAFDLIDNDRYSVVGNIHGLEVLKALDQPDRFRRQYRIVYQTRHPIPRFGSLAERWKYEASLSQSRADALRQQVEAALKDQPLSAHAEANDDARLFACAVHYLLMAERRYLNSSAPVVLFERLLADRDHFGWFVRQLMGGALEFGDELIDEIFASAPLDKRSSQPQAAKSIFNAWEGWQRDYFANALDRAGTRAHYAALGYEVSF